MTKKFNDYSKTGQSQRAMVIGGKEEDGTLIPARLVELSSGGSGILFLGVESAGKILTELRILTKHLEHVTGEIFTEDDLEG